MGKKADRDSGSRIAYCPAFADRQCVVENAAASLASETLIRYPAQAGHDDG
jgi:hypothetical protein